MTLPYFNSNRDAALFWYRYGLKSIPIVPGEKRPALPYSPWLDNVSAESVERHWRKHPDHGVSVTPSVVPHHLVLQSICQGNSAERQRKMMMN